MPIVEPEVLMDGDHTIEHGAAVTGRVLQAVYTELHDQRVQLEGTLLKPNMVLSGYEASRAQRAPTPSRSRRCASLYRHVPAAVPGIVFLSGGQSDEDATAHLERDERDAARTRGSSRSRTGARCRRRRSRRGAVRRQTSARPSAPSTTGRR